MDDTDEQEEDTSMEKMTDSFSKSVTVHGKDLDKTRDKIEFGRLESGWKSSEDVTSETNAPDSGTRYSTSASLDIRYLADSSERLRMRSLPFFYVPDGMYKRKISQAQSKIGSLDNISHSAGGGKKKIFSQKVDVSSVKSKTITKRKSLPEMRAVSNLRKEEDLTLKQASNSATQIHSKVGSLENISHKPQGGDKKILTYPVPKYKCKVSSKVDSSDPTPSIHQLSGGADQFFCGDISHLKQIRPRSAPGTRRISGFAHHTGVNK